MPLATEMTEKGGVSVSSLGQRQTEEPETGMLENEGNPVKSVLQTRKNNLNLKV